MRNPVLSAAFLGLAGAAFAQTYSVEPGLWEVRGEAVFSGIDIPVDTTDCVSPEDAQIDIAALLEQETGTDCKFDHANGSDFALSCKGETPITAAGKLDVDPQQVSLSATGTVEMEGVGPVPVSIDATAARIGTCP